MLMKAHGMSHPTIQESNSELMADVMRQQAGFDFVKVEQDLARTPTMVDEFMDDSPVTGDPMISASPLQQNSRRSSLSMDETAELTAL